VGESRETLGLGTDESRGVTLGAESMRRMLENKAD